MYRKEFIVAVCQDIDLSGPISVMVDLASEMTALLLLQHLVESLLTDD